MIRLNKIGPMNSFLTTSRHCELFERSLVECPHPGKQNLHVARSDECRPVKSAIHIY
ncbi:hypothetical protein FQR65_LT12281 [Abscondita terminalis]|nr:hypothetical protein FQR65_LT12281 [Abscondita terminalis]